MVDATMFMLRANNIKLMQTVLQMIKTKDKQDCVVTANSDGLSLRMQDDSKTLQAQIFLTAQLFAEYQCTRMVEFGLPLHLLLDTVGVLATLDNAHMEMCFPGPNQELVMQTQEGALCSYARLSSVDIPRHSDLATYWTDPSSTILAPGHILKEAIEDLEWPGGNVTMHLTNTPPGALLSARGPNGTLQVKLPLGGTSRTQMRLHGQEVQHSYSYRHLATALGNVGREQQQHVTSKVAIDSDGLMRVQHMLTVHGSGGDAHGPTQGGGTAGATSAAPLVAVVTFYVAPRDEEVDDGDVYGGGYGAGTHA